MKRNYSKVLSVLLICSFVLTSFSQVFAGDNGYSCLNQIYSDLNTAYNIVNGGNFYTETQNARPYLSHAQKLLKRQPCARHLARSLDREIDKAKTEILWNNKHDAIARISCAIQMVENMNSRGTGSTQTNQHTNSSNSGAGSLIAAPVAIGLGAILVGIFKGFNWGYSRTRVTPPRLPTSVVPVR
ncbi:MAG: hypothetical protein KKB51_08240 [Candidatus Riflebacteria bacterium]|nr:hypothetical protein [Candidatus Riflebacteria bacterium]